MHKKFFYEHRQEIKKIFNKHAVKNVYIAFKDQYPAIYIDYGQDAEKGSLTVISIEQELNILAIQHNEVFDASVISDSNANSAREDKAVHFDIFWSDALGGQTIFGELDHVKKLLAVSANISLETTNFNEPHILFKEPQAQEELKTANATILPQFRGPIYAQQPQGENSPPLASPLARRFHAAIDKTIKNFQQENSCDPQTLYKELYRIAEKRLKEFENVNQQQYSSTTPAPTKVGQV